MFASYVCFLCHIHNSNSLCFLFSMTISVNLFCTSCCVLGSLCFPHPERVEGFSDQIPSRCTVRGCSADPRSSSALIGFVPPATQIRPALFISDWIVGVHMRLVPCCGPLAVTVCLDFTAAMVNCRDLFRLFCHKHKSVVPL